MKLNLYIIKEELQDLQFHDSQYDSAGSFNISNVHFCTKTTKNMQTGTVYVIESKLLPERKDVYRLPSVICIGKPPLDWISSRTNILYTTKSADPQSVYDRVTEVFAKYQKIEDELTKLLDANEDLSCLDKFLPKYISNPFNLVNSAYEPIYQYFPKLDQNRLAAVKSLPNYGFYYSGEQRVISNAEIYMHSTDRKYRGILKSTNPSLYRMLGTGINMLFQNVYVDNTRAGYMEIIELVNRIKTSDYLILLTIAQKLNYWFKINTRIMATEDDIGALIYNLLRDKTVPYSRIAFTLGKVDWDEKDKYVLLLVSSSSGSMSIPKVDAYTSKISFIFDKIGHTTFDNYLVLICNLTKAKKTRQQVVDLLKSQNIHGVITAVSAEFSPIQSTYYAYTQTRVISKIGFLKRSSEQLFLPEDMYTEYFLYKCRKNQILEMLYPESLKKLMAYDLAKGTDFVNLLSVYLDNERSITKTSEEAFLHRNTTMYQINKIREIMGTDFEDPDERLVLQIAIKEFLRNIPDVGEINLNQIQGTADYDVSQDESIANNIDFF